MNVLAYVDQLQRLAADEVSFYPRQAIERGVEGGMVRLAFENGQPAGYIYRSHPRPGQVVKIWQAVIEYDVRRRGAGTRLVEELKAECHEAGALAITLRCRSSLDANLFWREMGFRCVNVAPGGRKRGADVNVWRYDVLPALFAFDVAPSARAEDQTEYRALTAAGFQFPSRFARREALR